MGQPVARNRERRHRPGAVHERDQLAREPAAGDSQRTHQCAEASGGVDEPEDAGAVREAVLDHVGNEDLGRSHEQQVGHRGAGERRPQPRPPADVAQAGRDLRAHRHPGHACRRGRLSHGEQRGGRGEKRAGVEREGAAGADRLHDHAAKRWTGQPQGDRTHELLERIGARQHVGGDELGDDGIERGVEERRGGAVQRRDQKQVPERQRPGERQQRQQPNGERTHEVGDQHDPPAVEPIAHRSAEEQAPDRRERHRDADAGQRGGRIGEPVHLPGQRDHEHAIAEQRDAHAAPQAAEFAVAQGRAQAAAGEAAAAIERLVAVLHDPRRGPGSGLPRPCARP